MAEKIKAKARVVKKKKTRVVPSGVAHIHSTRNNTIVTFTDFNGNVVAWSSSGAIGYKGSKKSTPYAAQLAAAAAAEKAKESGMKEIKVVLKGTGPGKIAAAKQLENSGMKILEMKDSTPIAHNGTRPPKRVRKRLKG